MHMLHIVGTEAHDQPPVLALLHVHRSAQARGGDVAHEGPVRDMEQAQAAVATVGNRQAPEVEYPRKEYEDMIAFTMKESGDAASMRVGCITTRELLGTRGCSPGSGG